MRKAEEREKWRSLFTQLVFLDTRISLQPTSRPFACDLTSRTQLQNSAINMTATTMHFGPEWMRKPAPSRHAPSPPLATNPASPSVSSYSALVAPASQPPPEKSDLARPFRYSKEDLLRIYKEGGGKGGLGLEVERWEGIVREVGHDPIGLKELSEAERKVRTELTFSSCSTSYNPCIRFLPALSTRKSVDVSLPITSHLLPPLSVNDLSLVIHLLLLAVPCVSA